jgi:ubiquinone/menaquinone biosynthesis C-methylase UbiE
MKVADVGCGGGLFSRKIAEKVGAKGVVVGFDNDKKLIEGGNTILREQGYHNVKLKVGDLYCLPIKASTFDLVTCHLVLYFLDTRKAVKEMIRICKRRGRISVMEPMFMRYYSVPLEHDRKVKCLEDRFFKTKAKYFKRLKKGNTDYQATVASLPSLFCKLGLRDVKVEGETVIFWPADFRHKKEFIIGGYKRQLDFVEREIEGFRPLLKNDFTDKELGKLKTYREKRYKNLIRLYKNKHFLCEFLLTVELIVSGAK